MLGFMDYGHGGADSGATNGGRYEKNDTFDYGRKVANRLKEHGINILESRTGDTNPTLRERTNIENANNCDFTISFHRNSFSDSNAKGVETWVYNGHINRNAGKLAKSVNDRLAALGFYNRGVKEGNLHMVRETKSPAILIEMGFISNSADNSLYDNKINDIVEAIVQGVCEYINISYKPPYIAPQPTPQEGTYYRVVCGSYQNRANAEEMQGKLKAAGFDSFLLAYNK